MEDVGRGNRARAALGDAGGEVIVFSDPAAGDHRDRNRLGDALDQVEVIPHTGAVAVDGVEEDFPRAEPLAALGPLGGGHAGRARAAMAEDFEIAVRMSPRVEVDDDALGPEALRGRGHEIRGFHGLCVDHAFVRPRSQAPADVVDGADPPAERKRHVTDVGDVAQQIERGGAFVPNAVVAAAPVVEILVADVEQNQLVHVPVGQARDDADRIADHLMNPESLAAHDQAVLEQQAGDQSGLGHGARVGQAARRTLRTWSRKRATRSSPSSWLFSGWNWTPNTFSRSTAAVTGVPP